MLEPTVLVCDEPVSALDVSVQAQILNLLDDLKRDRGLTMVFIAHDLAVVKNVSDRVAVMYLGKLCEVGRPDDLYHHPEHPYTEALLTAIPEPDPGAARNGKAALSGDLPSPINPPSGCRFRTRCPFAQQKCADEEPQMRAMAPDHFVACHFPLSTNPVTTDATALPYRAPVSPPDWASEPGPPAWTVQAPDSPPESSRVAPPSQPPNPQPATPPRPPQPAPATPQPSSDRGGDRPPLWIDPQP